jgi:hypothetical protein
MGGAISSAARGSITRDQLLRSTENGRIFTNKLFNVMLEKLTPADFLALGNPNKCSTFIFMMADGIQNLFRDLRIRPRRDKDTGVVYFQKVDTLRAQTAETRELCMTIAYFYIRIFQIFGALAMSILDDPGAGGVLGAIRYGGPQRPAAGPGGIFGIGKPKRIPGSYPAVLYGGAVPPGYFTSGYGAQFAPIKSTIASISPFTSENGSETYQRFYFLKNRGITLTPGDKYDGTPQNLKISIPLSSTVEDVLFKVFCNMSLQRIGDGKYEVTLRNFRTNDTRLTDQAQSTIKTIIEKFTISVSSDGTVKVANYDKSLADKLLYIGTKIMRINNGLVTNPYASIDDILESKKIQRERLAPEQARAAIPGTTVGIPKELQNEYIIAILKAMSGQTTPGQKTVAFCIARALQLLDANTLYTPRPQQAQSGVCMAKFDTLPTSVPQTGISIGSVPGIRAVDQLFYVNPSADHVRITDPAEYSDFLQQISGLFGKSTSAKLSKLDEVIAKDPNCPTAAAKQYLQIKDPRGIQKVLGVVNQMFARQLAHTQRVIKFFRERLFTIVKGREGEIVNIHPRLLQGGIAELAVVSKEARELLIQYYKDCETLYQRGAEEALRAGRV